MSPRFSGAFAPAFAIDVVQFPARSPPANDQCSLATVLTSGVPVSVDLGDATDAVQLSNCSGTGMRDLSYRIDLPNRSDLTAAVTGPGAFDMALGVATSSCAGPTTLACQLGFNETRLFGVGPGSVDVVVEPRFSSSPFSCTDRERFRAELLVTAVDSPPIPENDTCATAIPVGFPRGVGTIEFVPSTLRGATNELDTVQCPSPFSQPLFLPGPDVFYAIDLPEPGRLRVVMTPANFDVRLALIGGDCDRTAAFACDERGQFELAAPLPAGRYWLRVDSTASVIPADLDLTLTLLAP